MFDHLRVYCSIAAQPSSNKHVVISHFMESVETRNVIMHFSVTALNFMPLKPVMTTPLHAFVHA